MLWPKEKASFIAEYVFHAIEYCIFKRICYSSGTYLSIFTMNKMLQKIVPHYALSRISYRY